MRLVACIVVISLSCPLAFTATIKVPADYPTIQQAIDASKSGDKVLVSPGTYVENIDFKGKAITVMSSGGAGVTVIDGNQAGTVVLLNSMEGKDSVFDGFSITNGSGNGQDGGGIYCGDNTSPLIINNTITLNTASYCGGGIFCGPNSAPTIRNNMIIKNIAHHGGAIQCGYGNPISNPIIVGNIMAWNEGESDGGAIDTGPGRGVICSNIIHDNKSGTKGGGIWIGSAVPFYNNVVIRNTATNRGGGICCWGPSSQIVNTIIWDNYAPTGPEVEGGSPTILYCDVKGGWPGSGNIDTDPLFVDSANGDFHLTYPSPCKDAGSNYFVKEQTDFEGDPRIAYGTVDMGADEFYTHLYWTGNATPGGNVEIKFVGLPGTSPIGLCIGTGVLDPPLKSMWGDWYLKFPILGPVDLGNIPSPEGVLIIPGTIPGTPPPPYSIPMQGLIGAELSNLSVLEVK